MVKINAYEILSRAVEEGIDYGYRRAHKNTNNPTEGAIQTEIETAVMNALCEVLIFNEEE